MTEARLGWQECKNVRMMSTMAENLRYARFVLLVAVLIGCASAAPTQPLDVTSPPDIAEKDSQADTLPIQDVSDSSVEEVVDVWIDTIAIEIDTSDVTDSIQDTAPDTEDVPPTDVAVPDAADVCEPLLNEPVVETSPIVLGSAGAGGAYNPSTPGDAIEIVQGPQGGVHVEVAFEVTLSEEFTKSSAKMALTAHSFQPCCMGSMVGSYTNNKFLAFKKDPAQQVFVSGVVPVIFFQNEAIHYQDAECCVVLSLDVFGPQSDDIVASATAMQSFQCVDYF